MQMTSHATELAVSGVTENVRTLAMILGSGDAYYYMTILAVLGFILTLFMPNPKKKA